MNFILGLPLEVRLVFLFVLGVVVGNLANSAIYAWAYQPRRESPWLGSHPRDDKSNWLDLLPLFGWRRLHRKSGELGRGFWLRPIVVELLAGALFAGLYYWEIGRLALVRPFLILPNGGLLQLAPNLNLETWQALHIGYAGQVLLFTFLLIATFIDLDEQTIPDAVTVPAALAGLVLAAMFPGSFMPGEIHAAGGGNQVIEIVTLAFPSCDLARWPQALAGAPQRFSLLVALGCFWGWCAALLPWLWLPRRGFAKAVRMFVAYAMRGSNFAVVATAFVLGSAGIVLVWRSGGLPWIGLLTSLVGLAVGGGLIWLVRVIGAVTLGREAMGFGDVTLMAAIGSFVGWQACVMIFFLAPCLGLVLGIAQLILGGGRQIPYGPFLCLATLVVVLAWRSCWEWFGPFFFDPWLVPAVMGICFVALFLMLGALQFVRNRLFPRIGK
ncbi:MAG TPA: A24 family peptidase [Pirellulales bacterium]|nr:A24 family peptidase [Pirellulales bacterium]